MNECIIELSCLISKALEKKMLCTFLIKLCKTIKIFIIGFKQKKASCVTLCSFKF